MLPPKFTNDPIFLEVAQKYGRWSAPFVGFIGTVIGICSAFRDLKPHRGSVELVLPGIIEALFWTAIGIAVLFVTICLHYWLINRR